MGLVKFKEPYETGFPHIGKLLKFEVVSDQVCGIIKTEDGEVWSIPYHNIRFIRFKMFIKLNKLIYKCLTFFIE